jgi:hypothetical protein
MRLMQEPGDFIREAEQAFNRKSVQAACASYAADVVVESFVDGVNDRWTGIHQARLGWQQVFAALPRFQLRKTLVCADRTTIVNRWQGSPTGGRTETASGIEVWTLNPSGEVCSHCLYTCLRASPASSLRGKARFLLIHPVLGSRLELHRRAATGRAHPAAE